MKCIICYSKSMGYLCLSCQIFWISRVRNTKNVQNYKIILILSRLERENEYFCDIFRYES